MRTKTLLLTAALVAAGAASSMAQVYSVNAVGYINLSVPKGFSIIGNQLNATPNNQVQYVFGNLPQATTLYVYDNASGHFSINSYDTDFQAWDAPDQVIGPGTGVFILNSGSAYNVTFVGEVPQGTLNTSMGHGFNLVASQVPQGGLLQTGLGYIPSSTGGGDVVYQYVNSTGHYLISSYDSDFASWDVEPTLAVGEGAYIFRGATGAATWSRTFTVN